MTDGKYSIQKIKSIHIPFLSTFVAIDANGDLICERILTIEDDTQKSVQKGKTMLVDSLLEDEITFKRILNSDTAPSPTYAELTTFLEAEKCCICGKSLQWGKVTLIESTYFEVLKT